LVGRSPQLPAGVRGALISGVILLAEQLTARERHSVLTHELVHDERQIFPRDPALAAREEHTVDRIADERLAPLNTLGPVITARATVGAVTVDDLVDDFPWADRNVLERQLARWIDGMDRETRREESNRLARRLPNRDW
jgi:hypothetical protein